MRKSADRVADERKEERFTAAQVRALRRWAAEDDCPNAARIACIAQDLGETRAAVAQWFRHYHDDDDDDDHDDHDDGFAQLVSQDVYSDVDFVVGASERVVPAHKAILAARSPVMATLLFGSFTEALERRPVVRVPDVSVEAFLQLLQCVYADDPGAFTPDTAVDALDAARKYEVVPLRHACEQYLCSLITVADVCVLLTRLHGRHVDDIEQEALAFIATNAAAVFQTEGFMCLPAALVREVCAHDALTCSEADVFAAAYRWAQEEALRRGVDDARALMVDLLPLIRVPLMSLDQLVRVVQPTEVLGPDVMLLLFKYIALRDEQQTPAPASVWVCAACTLHNAAGAVECEACVGTERLAGGDAWSCGTCTFRNGPDAVRCVVCNSSERVFDDDEKRVEEEKRGGGHHRTVTQALSQYFPLTPRVPRSSYDAAERIRVRLFQKRTFVVGREPESCPVDGEVVWVMKIVRPAAEGMSVGIMPYVRKQKHLPAPEARPGRNCMGVAVELTSVGLCVHSRSGRTWGGMDPKGDIAEGFRVLAGDEIVFTLRRAHLRLTVVSPRRHFSMMLMSEVPWGEVAPFAVPSTGYVEIRRR